MKVLIILIIKRYSLQLIWVISLIEIKKDLDSVLICLKHLNKKIFHTTGNHDYKGITDNKVLYKKLKMPSEYYSFMKKNWVFVFLNTNEIAAYSNVVGTAKEQELLRIQNQIKVNKRNSRR